MIPAAFSYERAGSVEEAIELLGRDDDAKVLAGGRSLIPAMSSGSHARPCSSTSAGSTTSATSARTAIGLRSAPSPDRRRSFATRCWPLPAR